MKNFSTQKQEIETIREKNIAIKLSEADCDRISELCGKHNITVGDLLANFIGDLVDGTYTNGSDERMYAQNYFERCWFGMFPETTFTSWLINGYMYNIEDVYDLFDNLENGYRDLAHCETCPEEYDREEIGFLRTDIEDWEQELAEIKSEFLKINKNANWEDEVAKFKSWWENKEKLRLE